MGERQCLIRSSREDASPRGSSGTDEEERELSQSHEWRRSRREAPSQIRYRRIHAHTFSDEERAALEGGTLSSSDSESPLPRNMCRESELRNVLPYEDGQRTWLDGSTSDGDGHCKAYGEAWYPRCQA